MQDLSLHILDIVENAIASHASHVAIRITEEPDKDQMILEIEDNGDGIPSHLVKQVVDPFFTTRTTRKVGLGLSLLQQAARACEGDLQVESQQGKGTLVKANFRYNHIDLKPLGDMASTMITLIVGNAHMDFQYMHRKGDQAFCIDTVELKRELDDVPIDHPKVVQFVRAEIHKGLQELGHFL
jgi:anti-sigma regulatory factor (Ser/Thr protein kinase)